MYYKNFLQKQMICTIFEIFQRSYEPYNLEKWGDQVIVTVSNKTLF